jgi:hypothetical protein
LSSLLAVCTWVAVQLHQALAGPPPGPDVTAAPVDSTTGSAPGAGALGPAPSLLRGILRDVQGRPIAAASVFVAPVALAQPSLGPCEREATCIEDPREAPLERLLEALHRGHSFSQAENGTRTAVDGTWQLQTRSMAPWILWAEDGDRGALVERFEEDAAGGSHELTLLPLQVVEGRVKDAKERPIPGAHVHLVGDSLRQDVGAVTDADGHYRVALPHEGFTAVAHAEGFAPQRMTPPMGDQELNFVLDELRTCRVTVTREGQTLTPKLQDAPRGCTVEGIILSPTLNSETELREKVPAPGDVTFPLRP